MNESKASSPPSRLLAVSEYEELYLIRAALPPTLVDEVRASRGAWKLQNEPGKYLVSSVRRSCDRIKGGFAKTMGEMEAAVQGKPEQNAWADLSERGHLADMLDRMEQTEMFYQRRLGVDVFTLTSWGGVAREERNVGALEQVARAAAESARAAKESARQAEAAGASAEKWQSRTLLVAMIGVCATLLAAWFSPSSCASSLQRQLEPSTGMDAGGSER